MKKFFTLMAVGIFAVAAHAAGTAGSTKTTTTTTTSAQAAAAAPTDAEIMQIMTTANQAEVDAAKVAMSQAESKEVKDFAKHMQQEHSKNDQQGKSLAKQLKVTPKDHPRASAMKEDAKAKMATLKAAKGKEFDTTYINSQVAMHTQVLDDLQNTLIPAAQNPQLKSFLETTRGHVQHHLEQAQKLQASMTGATQAK